MGIFQACSFNHLLSLPVWEVIPICITNVTWIYTVPLVFSYWHNVDWTRIEEECFLLHMQAGHITVCENLHWSYYYICSTVERISQNCVHPTSWTGFAPTKVDSNTIMQLYATDVMSYFERNILINIFHTWQCQGERKCCPMAQSLKNKKHTFITMHE